MIGAACLYYLSAVVVIVCGINIVKCPQYLRNLSCGQSFCCYFISIVSITFFILASFAGFVIQRCKSPAPRSLLKMNGVAFVVVSDYDVLKAGLWLAKSIKHKNSNELLILLQMYYIF